MPTIAGRTAFCSIADAAPVVAAADEAVPEAVPYEKNQFN